MVVYTMVEMAKVHGLHSYNYLQYLLDSRPGKDTTDALEFDNRISLEGISEGTNDEIFQGNSPVLTGIDLSSTYIYLLEESGDRTADSWELFMSDRKDHGLELDVSISDAGTGLTAGIPRVFPEAALERRAAGSRPQKRTLEQLDAVRPEARNGYSRKWKLHSQRGRSLPPR